MAHSRLALAALALALAALAPVRADDPPPDDALAKARARGYLLWGADAEGGAPFVFADPKDPSRTIGFEVDLARELGLELGLEVRFEQREWASLLLDVRRGTVDFGMNGLEVTDEARKDADFTRPYFVFSEQLVVRRTEDRIATIHDLAGRTAGTLGGTLAERMLHEAGAVVSTYTGQVEPYSDLEMGRVDAVLLDLPITKYYADPRQHPELRWTGEPVGRGDYAIAVARGQTRLREALDAALAHMVQDGRLAKVLRRWELWDERQWSLVRSDEAGTLRGLFDSAVAPVGSDGREGLGLVTPPTGAEAPYAWLLRHGPLLLQAAVVTVALSVLSMLLAIGVGIPTAVARVYGGPLIARVAAVYVEVFRGTPVILQLYVLYYGLPYVGIELNAFTAAVLGLGLNYAAYEAEIYRAGLQAIPKGQMEAALALGLTRAQAIRRIVLPQAVRLVIPPVTNDFVALLKDTSIVSVIAIQELTKRFYILGRSDTAHFVHLAAVTALLYLAMSYPLSVWAQRMEKRLAGEGA